jgi:5-formyltetrahydrofolate cyclo-ligase
MTREKQTLRKGFLHRRESLPFVEFLLWNRLIESRVLGLPSYRQAASVALYSSIGNEVRTRGIRDHALDVGKKVFYPRLGRRELPCFAQVQSETDLREGRYGILEPVGDDFITERDREGLVIFVPGLAFDLMGNRLGRGKGWYDRILRQLGEGVSCIALAYEFQIIEVLPVEDWDRKVHQIVTEERIIDPGKVRSGSGDFSEVVPFGVRG